MKLHPAELSSGKTSIESLIDLGYLGPSPLRWHVRRYISFRSGVCPTASGDLSVRRTDGLGVVRISANQYVTNRRPDAAWLGIRRVRIRLE